eukprot:TRINITY_DN121223_c0_g1_i1.p1 TRINITY_DN121223_c0_g1~~TRINITY_DN121223_c0_g1_i1.p1  ORF type:complete len:277 (-),score=105.88 TRINITY_DN121223_c0_g1_i1:81-911(-)
MSGGGFYASKGGGKGGGGKGGGKASQAVVPAAGGGNVPGALKRKLEALGYPEEISLVGNAFCKTVLWLEEEKIRYYDKHERKTLRDFNRGWYTYAQDYCKELGVPAEGLDDKNAAVKLRVLNGLTNLAVHDIYRDKIEANELALAPPPKGIVAPGDKPAQKLQDLVEPLNRLLGSFSLPKLPDDAADTDTIAALQCIHVRVCPPKAKESGTTLDLDSLPVGLDIADPEVKRAACVLRLLHGNELQNLQVHINQVLNELQQLTAEPNIDARLGRVGR